MGVAANPDVTVIVPAMDEEESIPVLTGEITRALEGTSFSWELLWVDDGSSDASLAVMRRLAGEDRRVRWVAHDTNYGQSAALATGLAHARGRIIATLDADLQNDPADLPRLLDALESHPVELVNGVRARRHDNLVRRISSRIGNGFRNRLTGAQVTDVGCSLRVFHADVADPLPLWRGTHRFLPTLLAMNGARMMEIPVAHRARKYGRTKYGISNRLWVGIQDTLGVRWLLHRSVRPRVGARSEEGA
jgi:glycosyltransferase involved in cell wall biosynthesis